MDVKPPKAIWTSVLGRVFKVDYSEPITFPQLQASAMTYEIKHIKYCNGAEGKVKVSDEHVYFNYDFACMTETSYSLLVEFPEDMMAPDGTYEVTVNASPKGDKVVDTGGNPAKKKTFVTTLGDSCVSSNPPSEQKQESKSKTATSTTNHSTCSSHYKLTEGVGLQ